MKKFKIVHTQQGDVVVDEKAEIKDGDYNYNKNFSNILFCVGSDKDFIKNSLCSSQKVTITQLAIDNFKVIATISPFRVAPDIPMIIEESIEDLAISYLDRNYSLSNDVTTWQKLHIKTFIAGYKAAQYKYKHSEEDLRKAFSEGLAIGQDEEPLKENEVYLTGEHSEYDVDFKRIVCSLKPTTIELDVEEIANWTPNPNEKELLYDKQYKLKTESTKEGLIIKI